MITGGLGGLGVLACYELAASGQPYICTTSRSGRIGGGQRELVQMQENRGASKDEWLLREIQKRDKKLGEVLGKVVHLAQQRGVMPSENQEPAAAPKTTLRDFMKKKKEASSTGVLERVEQEIAAGGAASASQEAN